MCVCVSVVSWHVKAGLYRLHKLACHHSLEPQSLIAIMSCVAVPAEDLEIVGG